MDGATSLPYRPAGDGVPVVHLMHAGQEVQAAFNEFVRKGMIMNGCGGIVEVKGEANILALDSDLVRRSIFGPDPSDHMGPLEFKCTAGHTNRREHGKLIKRCKTQGCKGSVGCGPKPGSERDRSRGKKRNAPSQTKFKLTAQRPKNTAKI
jgi:hypothetical protein